MLLLRTMAAPCPNSRPPLHSWSTRTGWESEAVPSRTTRWVLAPEERNNVTAAGSPVIIWDDDVARSSFETHVRPMNFLPRSLPMKDAVRKMAIKPSEGSGGVEVYLDLREPGAGGVKVSFHKVLLEAVLRDHKVVEEERRERCERTK